MVQGRACIYVVVARCSVFRGDGFEISYTKTYLYTFLRVTSSIVSLPQAHRLPSDGKKMLVSRELYRSCTNDGICGTQEQNNKAQTGATAGPRKNFESYRVVREMVLQYIQKFVLNFQFKFINYTNPVYNVIFTRYINHQTHYIPTNLFHLQSRY